MMTTRKKDDCEIQFDFADDRKELNELTRGNRQHVGHPAGVARCCPLGLIVACHTGMLKDGAGKNCE